MKVVYKNRDCRRNLVSVTTVSNVPSTLRRYAFDCVDGRRATHKCRSAYHAAVDLAFITDNGAKMLKTAT